METNRKRRYHTRTRSGPCGQAESETSGVFYETTSGAVRPTTDHDESEREGQVGCSIYRAADQSVQVLPSLVSFFGAIPGISGHDLMIFRNRWQPTVSRNRAHRCNTCCRGTSYAAEIETGSFQTNIWTELRYKSDRRGPTASPRADPVGPLVLTHLGLSPQTRHDCPIRTSA